MDKAVALTYTTGLPAPFIVAKGKRALACKLREIAEENGITIVDDEKLTESLFQFEPGSCIPEDLYGIVAELLAFVYSVDLETKNTMQDDT